MRGKVFGLSGGSHPVPCIERPPAASTAGVISRGWFHERSEPRIIGLPIRNENIRCYKPFIVNEYQQFATFWRMGNIP